jgi:hypothetical protein
VPDPICEGEVLPPRHPGGRKLGSRDVLLATADGAPADAVATVRAVLTAVRQKKLSAKLARELLVRVAPPARPTVTVDLPAITDAASHAAAQAAILEAVSSGRVPPAEGKALGEVARRTYEAMKSARRAQMLGLA